jgi:ABC-type phosphate/phosphonate transport system substrate-binding protein
MKARALLLILLLAVVGYFSYELVQKRDPFTRITGVFKSTPLGQTPKPTQAEKIAATPDDSALVLSAPPRDDAAQGAQRFDPLAEYLSNALGRKVTYRHPGTWGGYQSDLQRDAYDIIFDGPHFVSWRIEKFNHHAVVKLPGDFLYVGFVRKASTQIENIDQLAGQPVCVHAPPNLGTLMLLSAFDNPSRQPKIVITKGYDKIYEGVMAGQCVAGMLPKKHLAKHDVNGQYTRVIYSHRPYPEQALTTGPRVSAKEREMIANALTAAGAESMLPAFRDAYALGGWFVPATDAEYAGLGAYLKTVPGFYR